MVMVDDFFAGYRSTGRSLPAIQLRVAEGEVMWGMCVCLSVRDDTYLTSENVEG